MAYPLDLKLPLDCGDVIASSDQRCSRSRERLFGTLISAAKWEQAGRLRAPCEGWSEEAGRDTELPEILARDLEDTAALDGWQLASGDCPADGAFVDAEHRRSILSGQCVRYVS
jgi:hypothetical protein